MEVLLGTKEVPSPARSFPVMSSEDRLTPRRGVAYAPRVPSPRAFAMMGQTGVVAQASYGMTDSGSGISLGALQSSMPGLTAPLTVTDLLHMQQQVRELHAWFAQDRPQSWLKICPNRMVQRIHIRRIHHVVCLCGQTGDQYVNYLKYVYL